MAVARGDRARAKGKIEERTAIRVRLTPEKEIHRESTLRESELSAGHKGLEYCLL